MKFEDLKVGRYVLTRDVDNPLVDRRKSGWQGMPKIRQGTVIHVRDDSLDVATPTLLLCIGLDRLNTVVRPRRRQIKGFETRCKFFDDLLAAMGSAPPSNAQELVEHLNSQFLHAGPATLQRLIDQGKLTLEDIEQAAKGRG